MTFENNTQIAIFDDENEGVKSPKLTPKPAEISSFGKSIQVSGGKYRTSLIPSLYPADVGHQYDESKGGGGQSSIPC